MADKNNEADLVAFLGRNNADKLMVPMVNVDEDLGTVAERKSSKKQRDGSLSGTCVICEDPRGSVHFGVISCAACSAFFRRTVAEKRKYSCRRSGEGHLNCPIDQKHRCYCRACRLQKCLALGMDPASVQLHRDTYGSKHIMRSRSETSLPQQENDDDLSEESGFSAGQSLLMLRENTNRANLQSGCPVTMSSLATSVTSVAVLAEQLLSFPHTPSYSRREIGDAPFHFGSRSSVYEAMPQQLQRIEPLPLVPVAAAMPTLSLNHRSADINVPRNMIEVMVNSYQQMLERRRLVFCPSSIRDILGGTKPTARPACYFGERVRRDRLRVDIALLVEFLNSIVPFTLLELNDKVALMKHFSVSFSILEKYYITMRAGGLETNRIFHSDGTYSDLDDPYSIAKEANKVSDGSVDHDTLNKLFIQSLKDFLLELSVPMYHNKMTDVEFCALSAVLLFDPAAPGLSESGGCIVREARDQVYNNWFELYRKAGVEDIGQRVGNTILLLPAVQTIVDTTQENFRLIQIFDLFHYDEILNELMHLDD